MATEYSAEDIKQRYTDAMGQALGAVHNELWQECAALHSKWHEYVELCGTNPERVALLNQAAPAFFNLV